MEEPIGTLTPLSETDQMIADPEQDVRGRTVIDSNGEKVGTVADLLVDTVENHVRFLRVTHGGILGIGAVSSFIPVDAVRRVTDDEVLIDSAKDRIAGAPQYDPDLIDQRDYYEKIYGHYGYPPYWAPGYLYPPFPGIR
ncbi:photosystem reaction center subunit H [Actinoplanes lobatus]|uniref:Photosystem reaction center subunit H n=1 Tax=Actinoplanes lobatus TaxID=113568 RepID=A0A7W7HIP5_9ACTN|nr:PRC-barrel domain-containing protein [Actinoplanes lobatus]MBB4751271.1 sporulation protein YlmC with PRC-barrel domain [Actinoplanes lobatus]GGN63225.1 photosystem reaction center subunit H [Actinoplanes lobatus]GIE44787.1 photosystem reaction center subunit H [Actinoplanes lobatus]